MLGCCNCPCWWPTAAATAYDPAADSFCKAHPSYSATGSTHSREDVVFETSSEHSFRKGSDVSEYLSVVSDISGGSDFTDAAEVDTRQVSNQVLEAQVDSWKKHLPVAREKEQISKATAIQFWALHKQICHGDFSEELASDRQVKAYVSALPHKDQVALETAWKNLSGVSKRQCMEWYVQLCVRHWDPPVSGSSHESSFGEC